MDMAPLSLQMELPPFSSLWHAYSYFSSPLLFSHFFSFFSNFFIFLFFFFFLFLIIYFLFTLVYCILILLVTLLIFHFLKFTKRVHWFRCWFNPQLLFISIHHLLILLLFIHGCHPATSHHNFTLFLCIVFRVCSKFVGRVVS